MTKFSFRPLPTFFIYFGQHSLQTAQSATIELLDHVRDVNLLVLDDMGAERSNDFAEEKLFQILDYRYEERLPTIITTGRLDVIERNRPRIMARLSDRLVVTSMLVLAPDYRRTRFTE